MATRTSRSKRSLAGLTERKRTPVPWELPEPSHGGFGSGYNGSVNSQAAGRWA
jgi:hypothetical protein